MLRHVQLNYSVRDTDVLQFYFADRIKFMGFQEILAKNCNILPDL